MFGTVILTSKTTLSASPGSQSARILASEAERQGSTGYWLRLNGVGKEVPGFSTGVSDGKRLPNGKVDEEIRGRLVFGEIVPASFSLSA
jgi:hypothetical protein